jgi:hypothetical protein
MFLILSRATGTSCLLTGEIQLPQDERDIRDLADFNPQELPSLSPPLPARRQSGMQAADDRHWGTGEDMNRAWGGSPARSTSGARWTRRAGR